MRRILIFALLFGVGLYVLLRLDRSDEETPKNSGSSAQQEPAENPDREAADPGAPVVDPGGATPVIPDPSVPGQDGDQEFVILSGATEFNRFDPKSGQQLLAFKTGNMRPLGDPRDFLYQFFQTEIRGWDTESGEEAMVVRADQAEGKIEISSTSEFRGLADDGLLEMKGVHVDVLRGHSMAPFTLTGDELTTRLELGRLRGGGEEPVVLQGQGFTARGWNVDLERDAGRVVFLGGGEFEFTLDNGDEVRFVTEPGSPLRLLHEIADGIERFVVNVDGGGTLTLTGKDPWELRARGLSLRGSRVDGGSLQLERVDTQGRIEAQRGPNRFSGSGARLVRLTGTRGFDLQIEDNPKAELALENNQGELEAVEIRGQGPLVVTAEALEGSTEQADIEFQKSGVIEFPSSGSDAAQSGAKVEFQEGLAVWVDRQNRSGTFRATGHVSMSQGNSWVRTEVLDSIVWSAEQRIVDLSCEGPTKARLTDQQGERLDFSASRGAQIQLQGQAWRVPQASGVQTSQVGPTPLEVHADELRDLDWAARTFRVWGNVGVQNALGRVQCERAVSEGDDRLVLTGTEATPALIELLPGTPLSQDVLAGTLRAMHLDLQPDRILAEGAVDSDLTLRQGRIQQRSQDLRIELDRSTAPELGYRLIASGDSQVTWEVAGNTLLTAESEQFTLVGSAPRGILENEDAQPAESRNPYAFTASAVRSMQWNDGERRYHLSAGSVESTGTVIVQGNDSTVEPETMRAEGGVDVSLSGPLRAEASAASLTVDPQTKAIQFTPYEGEKVVIVGMLPKLGIPYRMQCGDLTLSEEKLEAIEPEFRSGIALLPTESDAAREERQPGESLLRAGRLVVTGQGMEFSDGVFASGTDMQLVPISIQSETLSLRGDLRGAAERSLDLKAMERVEVKGGFLVVYGGLARARGRELVVLPTSLLLKGDSQQRVRVELSDLYVETDRMEVDLNKFLVKTTRGVMRGGSQSSGWALDYASLHPVERNGETMFAIASPQYVEGKRTANANWAMAWIHPEAWRQRGRSALWGEPLPEERSWEPKVPHEGVWPDVIESMLASLSKKDLPHYLRAVLLEGNVETSVSGRRLARADSMYFDVDGTQAWLKEAEITRVMRMAGKDHKLRIQTGELIAEGSGMLSAKSATITTCDHDVPHYVIETKDLRLIPRGDQRWKFQAVDNRIAFQSGFGLPIPSIRNVVLDSEGGFEGFENEEGGVTTVENVALRNTPRFGVALGTVLAYDIDKVGKAIARLLQFDADIVQGRWKFDGSWLSDRGPLLGLGLELREPGRERAERELFWLDLYARGIYDEGEDGGLLPVPDDETDTLRYWLSARGRYPFDDKQWIDLVVNTQTDPGVQAEFFQNEYQEYEERDSYVHWRKARDGHFFNARYQWRQDNFRTTVEQLPSVGAYRGMHELFRIGKVPVHYSASADVAQLRRLQGDPRFEDWFLNDAGVFDGLGDQTVLRGDTTHRLESRLPLEIPGTSLTPFLEGRFTAWDQGGVEDDEPTRFASYGGARLQSLWTRVSGSSYHTLIPRVIFSKNLALEESGGEPILFDDVERDISGDFFELGLRSLWSRPDVKRRLDYDVALRERTDRDGNLLDQQELRALGNFRTEFGGWGAGVEQFLRLDLENDETLYSRLTLALKPSEDLLFQISHQRGADPVLGPLFEAATLDLRYRINPKWEVEMSNSDSILEGGNLYSALTLRRFSHDFVLELEVSRRAGEGGTGFGINFMPLLAWKAPRLGILDR